MRIAKYGGMAIVGILVLVLLSGCDVAGSRDFSIMPRFPGSVIFDFSYALRDNCITYRSGPASVQQYLSYHNQYATVETSENVVLNHYISVLGARGYTYRGMPRAGIGYVFTKGDLVCPASEYRENYDIWEEMILISIGPVVEPVAPVPAWAKQRIWIDFYTTEGVDPLVPPS